MLSYGYPLDLYTSKKEQMSTHTTGRNVQPAILFNHFFDDFFYISIITLDILKHFYYFFYTILRTH
jgi:hypothetical protein